MYLICVWIFNVITNRQNSLKAENDIRVDFRWISNKQLHDDWTVFQKLVNQWLNKNLASHLLQSSVSQSVSDLISPSGSDPPAPPAVCGGSPHPQHLPHVGGCDELLSSPGQWRTHRLQDHHSAGIHRVQSQPDGRPALLRPHHSSHRWGLITVPSANHLINNALLCLLVFIGFPPPVSTQVCSSWCAWPCWCSASSNPYWWWSCSTTARRRSDKCRCPPACWTSTAQVVPASPRAPSPPSKPWTTSTRLQVNKLRLGSLLMSCWQGV